MNVNKLKLTNVLRYTASELELPQCGVVLVTGDNGAGKSSIVEAVSVACWGKTLRGTEPWRDGGDGEVALVADLGGRNLNVLRGRKGGRNRLSFLVGLEPEAKYDTATKAQEALVHVVGEWDVWRRTAVFSSADAAHFTLATDGERKRLLESILGLGVFDDALEACRVDIKGASREAAALDSERSVLAERRAGAERSLKDAEAALSAAPPPPPPGEREDILQAARDKLLSDRTKLREEQQGLEVRAQRLADQRSRASLKVDQIELSLKRVVDRVCYACGQAIDAGLRAKLEGELSAAKVEAAAACASATAERDRLKDDLDDLVAEVSDVQESLREVEGKIGALDANRRAAAMWDRLSDSINSIRAQVTEVISAVETNAAKLRGAQARSGVLAAVESVLGLRGVRVQLLSRMLSGLEAASNAWLGRIAGAGLRLRLKPYVEKKTGGIADALSLEVEGAGGGFGYRASSQGERRRIDVALLLALADVAAASHGVRPGTMFFDEVFDSLDDSGVEAVCEVLGELARDRCVVVVTHSTHLAVLVPKVMRLEVRDGRIERV